MLTTKTWRKATPKCTSVFRLARFVEIIPYEFAGPYVDQSVIRIRELFLPVTKSTDLSASHILEGGIAVKNLFRSIRHLLRAGRVNAQPDLAQIFAGELELQTAGGRITFGRSRYVHRCRQGP